MYLAKIPYACFDRSRLVLLVMPERFDCTFIERRIDQLIDEAIEHPEGSPEQERIDGLISELQDRLVDRLEGTPCPGAGDFFVTAMTN
jgi:hypothetical protein